MTSSVLVTRPWWRLYYHGKLFSFPRVLALAFFISQQIGTYPPAYFFQLDERDEIRLLG
jgi:hypothetical protein